MIINRIYMNTKSSVFVACFLLGRAKDLSAPCMKLLIFLALLFSCFLCLSYFLQHPVLRLSVWSLLRAREQVSDAYKTAW